MCNRTAAAEEYIYSESVKKHTLNVHFFKIYKLNEENKFFVVTNNYDCVTTLRCVSIACMCIGNPLIYYDPTH